MNVYRIVVGAFDTNCYVLWQEGERECIVVDPGDEPDEITSFLENSHIEPVEVILTHVHVDHFGAMGALLRRYPNLGFSCGRDDEPHLTRPTHSLAFFFGGSRKLPGPARLLEEGDEVLVGEEPICVVETPGHTPGSIALYSPRSKLVLTGDCLFAGGIGRTDFPGGSYAEILRSIQEKLILLPPETRVLPGHGEESTIGAEKATNPFVSP